MRAARVLALVPAALFVVPAHAIPSERVTLDQRTATAKNEVLELNVALANREEVLLYPPHSRVSFYVDKRVSGFILEEVRVYVDNREVASHRYTLDEARALTKSGLHRLAQINVGLGEHALRAEFSGRTLASRGNPGEPVSGAISSGFSKSAAPLDIVLPIARRPRGQAAPAQIQRLESSTLLPARVVERAERAERAYAIRTREGEPTERYQPGTAGDPRLGYAQFLYDNGRFFSALVELLRLRDVAGDSGLPEAHQWLLADSYLAFGMHADARAQYVALSQSSSDRARALRALMRIAEFEYQRGYVVEATERLRALRDQVEGTVFTDWQDLYSRVLLAQGRHAEAADVLLESGNINQLPPFARYNLGVALINAGQTAQGRSVLERVGLMTVNSDEELALRDRANLVLGYHFLRNNQGGTAKPLFSRIRVDGPFSNRGLLGMGWAELAPEGDRQPRALMPDEEAASASTFASLGSLVRPGYFDPDIYRRIGNRPFKLGRIDDDEEAAMLRALVPWTELTKRDPMNEAVQEALLAIPYTLDRLGAHEQALTWYLRAIETFEEGQTRIDAGIRSVNAALMMQTIVRRDLDAESGYTWRLLDLPDLPETYWLNELLAEHRFQEQLKNYRDLRLLERNLDQWERQIVALQSRELDYPPLPPDLLFTQIGRPPVERDLPALRLRSSERLGMLSIGQATPASRPSVSPLSMSPPPERFEGPREALLDSVYRIGILRPFVAELTDSQSVSVRQLAVSELETQRSVMDDYLLEARFAVARIYDQRMRDSNSEEVPQ